MSAYEQLGGEAALLRLTERFYELMDTLPEAWELRKMHPESLDGSRRKLFMYLSGWLGGPDLFVESFGHPRLRARHLPFEIDDAARDQWMMCMQRAIDEILPGHPLAPRLLEAISGLADHMRNRMPAR